MTNLAGFERRSNLEIIASILEVCRYGNKKTRVMGMCGMSSRQLTDYLDLLLKTNLLSVDNGGRSLLFRISAKGKHYLQAYKNITKMME